MVMYVVERHPNGSSRTVPATDVFTHLNHANIKVMTGCVRRFFNSRYQRYSWQSYHSLHSSQYFRFHFTVPSNVGNSVCDGCKVYWRNDHHRCEAVEGQVLHKTQEL